MKQSFALSKSNKIYFGVIASLFLFSFVVFSEKSPYKIGELTGSLVSLLLFPSLFAWIIWRLSGRKEIAGSLTFNIFLSLILLGQIGQFANKLHHFQISKELQEQKEKFKKDISDADNPAKIDASYSKYKDSLKNGLTKLSETSTGQDKQFYRIMSDFVTESNVNIQSWRESYNAVLSSRILNYSILNSDEEFAFQKNIINLYVEKTKASNESFANMVPNLKKRLRVLGEGNKLAQGAIKGATEKHLSQKPILEPLMQSHIEYGKNMIQILELLQKNKDLWAYKNDQLLIYSDTVQNEYNKLIEKLGTNEATINTLSEKLTENM